MDLGLKNKVAMVTASSRGLGRAVAATLAAEGANVVICARNDKDLEAVKQEILTHTESEVLAVQADLTKPADIEKVVAKAVEIFNTIHILVNNAGGPPPGFFEDMTDERWQKGIELTLMSSVRLTRQVLPLMRK